MKIYQIFIGATKNIGVLLPGKSHGRRSLEGCSPWGRWGSDTTERLHFHFSLSCIGEGNGNPLQCSCLENPRDGEPGGLPSMGSHRVGHDWSDLAVGAKSYIGLSSGASGKELTCQCSFDPWVRKISWRRAWQPTPVFLLRESHGQRILVGNHRVAKSQTRLKWLSMHTHDLTLAGRDNNWLHLDYCYYWNSICVPPVRLTQERDNSSDILHILG